MSQMMRYVPSEEPYSILNLTAIQLVAHICATFFSSFIHGYVATTVNMLRSRAVAQMKALLLLFNVSVSSFHEALVAVFLFDLQEAA